MAPTLSDKQRCSGCGRCVAVCSSRLYTLEPFGRRKLSLNEAPEKCTGCSRCVKACPLGLLVDGTMTV
jgi:ferredoxin